jgi:threonine aldolase
MAHGDAASGPARDGDRDGDRDDLASRLKAHWATSSRQLRGHGRRDPLPSLERVRALVDGFPADPTDVYGDGGIVAALEEEVRDLLGTEAAAFLPSGTMAQQVTLRIHAERAGTRTVAWHPRCHLDLWEAQGPAHLHGLVPHRVGDADRVLGLDDLTEVVEPLAAVLWELPQRDLGGLLPTWDDLVAQVVWARERGIATHLDGARLWTTTPHYDRSPAEIAGLFDTIYVSFYKDLGAWAGCVLAGPTDVVDQVRLWRHRHGGTLYALWPYAASALDGLRRHLPRIPEYAAHARALAASVADLTDVAVAPDPPHTTMFHLWVRQDADTVIDRLVDHARRSDLATWPGAAPARVPGWSRLELTVGEATLAVDADEFRELVEELVAPGA